MHARKLHISFITVRLGLAQHEIHAMVIKSTTMNLCNFVMSYVQIVIDDR